MERTSPRSKATLGIRRIDEAPSDDAHTRASPPVSFSPSIRPAPFSTDLRWRSRPGWGRERGSGQHVIGESPSPLLATLSGWRSSSRLEKNSLRAPGPPLRSRRSGDRSCPQYFAASFIRWEHEERAARERGPRESVSSMPIDGVFIEQTLLEANHRLSGRVFPCLAHAVEGAARCRGILLRDLRQLPKEERRSRVRDFASRLLSASGPSE